MFFFQEFLLKEVISIGSLHFRSLSFRSVFSIFFLVFFSQDGLRKKRNVSASVAGLISTTDFQLAQSIHIGKRHNQDYKSLFLDLVWFTDKSSPFFWKISHQRQNLKIFLKFKPRLNDGLLHINSISCFKIQVRCTIETCFGGFETGVKFIKFELW